MSILYKANIWKMAAMAAVAALAFSSCEEERKDLAPIAAPAASVYSSTVSSLTFYWDKIDNASQYGYRLLSADGEVVDGGVTSGTTATFTGLKDNTTYTLEIWAYSAYGSEEYDRSKSVTLTGTTPKIVPLPAPSASVSTGDGIQIYWDAVENASYYSYCYYPAGNEAAAVEGTTDYTSVKLSMLDPGDYEFKVKAISGEEAYSDSEYARIPFTAVKEKRWEVNGVFTPYQYEPDKCWNATMEGWSDGSYVIRNWYNVEGYDLEFTVDSWGILTLTNADSYGSVASGLYGDYHDIATYTAYYNGYYSCFTGDQKSGDLYFWNYEVGPVGSDGYHSGGYSTFEWPKSVSSNNVTIDDITGTWKQNTTGWDYTGYYSDNGACTATNDVTITKTGDNTVSVYGLFTSYDFTLAATFDENAQTLTFAPQDWLTYYVFSAYGDSTASVVASVSKDTITINDWSARSTYGGVWYDYVYGMTTTLTR